MSKTILLAICITLVLIIPTYLLIQPKSDQKLISAIPEYNRVKNLAPLEAKTSTPEPTAQATTQKQPDKVDISQLEQIIAQYPMVDVSLSAKILNSDIEWHINSQRSRVAASTTKLFAASAALQKIENNQLTLDQKLGSYNLKFQLQQMVNQSNNISWTLFYDLIGRQTIQSYIHGLGSKSFSIADNTLQAPDMVNYLEKLVRGDLHNAENTKYLLSLMQKTQEEDFIPQQLENYELFHKNGQLETVVNEAVIAKGSNQTILIAIYTDGKDGTWKYEDRKELFKKLISKILEKP